MSAPDQTNTGWEPNPAAEARIQAAEACLRGESVAFLVQCDVQPQPLAGRKMNLLNCAIGTDTPRYTLEEAKAELKRQDCKENGHELSTEQGPGMWEIITCNHCGKTWRPQGSIQWGGSGPVSL